LQRVQVQRMERVSGAIVIEARAIASGASCPGCGVESKRVHGRYQRIVRDAAVAGAPVVIRLQVRRFVCGQDICPRHTFAEQIVGSTVPRGRYTPLLRQLLTSIGLALAGRGGARLTAALGMT